MADRIQTTADVEVVKGLFLHLIAAFEQFAEQQSGKTAKGLTYIDAVMGCHNFYKAVILDLERREPKAGNMFRYTAVDTLALSLGVPIQRVKQ